MHRPHSVRQAPLAPITSILVGQRDREAPEGTMPPEASRWCRNGGFVQYMGPQEKRLCHLQFQGPGHAHAYGTLFGADVLHLGRISRVDEQKTNTSNKMNSSRPANFPLCPSSRIHKGLGDEFTRCPGARHSRFCPRTGTTKSTATARSDCE